MPTHRNLRQRRRRRGAQPSADDDSGHFYCESGVSCKQKATSGAAQKEIRRATLRSARALWPLATGPLAPLLLEHRDVRVPPRDGDWTLGFSAL